MSEEYKVEIIYGTVEPLTLHKFENGRMVTYGYAIYRDRNGIETRRTIPEPISSLGWDNGKPFTEKDYRKLLNT